MKSILLGILRHLLTGIGGAGVTKGWLSADDATAAAGAIITLAGIAWSIWDKTHPKPPVTPPGPPQGGGNLARLPMLGFWFLVSTFWFSGCAFTTHKVTYGTNGTNVTMEITRERLWQGCVVTIEERAFGVQVAATTASTQTPRIQAGFFSSAVRIVPTSTNEINIPRLSSCLSIGNSISPFSLGIEEDFVAGDVEASSNATNFSTRAITPK